MKFNCGPTQREKEMARQAAWEAYLARITKWHDFFTIIPRRVGSRDCRFLETIERKGELVYAGYSVYKLQWEYRAKEKSE